MTDPVPDDPRPKAETAGAPLPPPPLSRLRASLLLLLVAFIWGSAFVAQKTAFPEAGSEGGGDPELGPLAFTGLRFLLGALIVLPFALREGRRATTSGAGPMPRRWVVAFGGVGVVLFLAAWTQQIGIIGTSVTNAGFLTAVYVPLVPVLGLALFRQPVRPIIWFGALGSLTGAWFLTGAAGVGLSALSAGDLWVLVSALFWALHVILVGQSMARLPRPLTLATVQFAACALLGCGAAALLEPTTLAGLGAVWPELLYAGGLSVGVAYTLQVVAQRHTPPAAAALILSTEMVFAALAGAVALGERLAPGQWIGAALILASILVVEVSAAVAGRRRGPGPAASHPDRAEGRTEGEAEGGRGNRR